MAVNSTPWILRLRDFQRNRTYFIFQTAVARRVIRWALEELGLKYEHVPLNTQGDSRKPEYLKVNPKGHVPALEDDGQVFWESMAVNLYLAEEYGKAPLWPSSAADHGHAYQWS